jgi:hypothetical protein
MNIEIKKGIPRVEKPTEIEQKLEDTNDLLMTTAIAVADSYEETDSTTLMLMDAIAQVYEELQVLKGGN